MFEMSNKLAYYSRKYLSEFTNTTSLNKLNKMSLEENDRFNVVLSAYLFYNKNKLNKYVYKELHKQLVNFEKSLKKKEKTDKFYKVQMSLERMLNNSNVNRDFKLNTSKEVKRLLKEKNLSLNFLVSETDVKYSNAYNFFNNNNLNKLSREKLMTLYRKAKEC